MRTFGFSFMMAAVIGACPCAGMAETVQSTAAIQDQMDNALLGDVIHVPDGRYEGKLALKNGVALLGAEGGGTIIDGSRHDIAIVGCPDTVISNLTIIGGKTGVDTMGSFMGIFDCRFKGQNNMAIHVSGGSAVIVNNVITGGSISCNSSDPVVIGNTLVPGETDGIWSWYSPGPSAINNLITGARCAVMAGAGAAPKLDNNAYWANQKDVEGCEADAKALCADPLFVDPLTGDYRLSPLSPMIGAGIPVAGIWENVRPDIGWNAGRNFLVEECRAIMNHVAATLEMKSPSVTYTLGEAPGEFLVTVRHPNKSFSICSSTPETDVTDIEAFDTKGEESLSAELVRELYPRVNVRRGLSQPAPTASPEALAGRRQEKPASAGTEKTMKDTAESENRYTLRNTYKNIASYHDGDNGVRVFKRKTNIYKVIVEIPEGFRPGYALRNGVPIEGELSSPLEIRESGIKEIEVGLEKVQEIPQE